MKRHTAKGIREFRCLGLQQQKLRSTIYNASSNDQINNSYNFFGINLSYTKRKVLFKIR